MFNPSTGKPANAPFADPLTQNQFGMKKILLKSLLLLSALIVGMGNVWGDSYTLGWGSVTGDEGTFTNFTETSGTVTDIVGFSTAQNSATNPPFYSSSSNLLRLYYNSKGNGGSITLTPASGVTITDVSVYSNTEPSVKYSVNGGSATAVSKSDGKYSVSGISATSSLSFQNVNTSNVKLDITKIEITYTSSGGDKTPCVDASTITLEPGDFDIKGHRTGTFVASGTKTDAGASFSYSTTATSGLTVAENGAYTASVAGSYTVKVTATPSNTETYSTVVKSFDITLTDTRSACGLAYTPNSYNANLGEDFDTPTLTNPYSLSISYSSSPASVATVKASTGAVTLLKEGTVTITATTEGSNDYKGGSASYTITITDPNKKVFDFEQNSNDYGSGVTTTSDGSTYVETKKTWTIDGVKIDTEGKYRWWNSSGSYTLRFYTTGTTPQGTKMTISAPTGKVIKAIAITGGQQFSSSDGAYSSSKGKWEGQATSVVLTYAKGSGSIDVKTVSVTIADPFVTVGDALYTTYTTLVPVTFTGVTAYTVPSVSSSAVTLSTKTEAPANTPVIIKAATKGTYTLTYKSDAASVGTNLLLSSDGTVEGDGSTIYALANGGSGVGFYPVGVDVKIPAGKAYLDLSGSGAPSMLRFEFEEENATSVETIQATDKAVKFFENGNLYILRDGVVYDALGRVIR